MAKETKEVKEEKSGTIEEQKIEKKAKGYKVKKLGFVNGKRNFVIDGKNILLIEGETVGKEDYELFTDDAKKILFE